MINIKLKQKGKEAAIEVQEKGKDIKIGGNDYEIIDQAGSLRESGVIVLNCLPVKPEGREKFEERFLNRPNRIEDEEGFIAIRVSRPFQGDTYIILTQWASETAFRNWQSSDAYSHAHNKRGTRKGIDREAGVLKSKPWHELYDVSEKRI